MTHRTQVETLKYAQRLAKHRPLGPGTAFAHRIAPIIDRDRRFDRGAMGGQVAAAKKAAPLDVVSFEVAGDVVATSGPPIKAIGKRLEFFRAIASAAFFFVNQAA